MHLKRLILTAAVLTALTTTVEAAYHMEGTELVTDNTLYYVPGDVINSAESLRIITTANFTTAPLTGTGIYNYFGDLSGKTSVTIETSGNQADGIMQNAFGGTTLKLGNNLTITTQGYSADGINLTENAYGSSVIVGDDAVILATGTTGGMGIRANNSINGTNLQSNSIQVGDRLTVVTNGSGNNYFDGLGYGIYAGLRLWKTAVSDSHVFIGQDSSITTYGDSAHAVYANRSGKIVLGSGTKISIGGNAASALRAEAGTGAVGSTSITLLGDTVIITDATKTGQYAMYAIGGTSSKGIITNVESDGTLTELGGVNLTGAALNVGDSRVFAVTGNFYSATKGLIHLDMTNGTKIEGITQLAGTGADRGNITWTLSGSDSYWLMTGDSTLTNLTLNDGATVYLNQEEEIGQTLTVEGNYTGNNGTVVFNGQLDGDASPIDQLVVQGDVAGKTNVTVNNIGGLGEKTVNGIQLITVGGASPSDAFKQSGRIVSGAYDYFLQQGNEAGADNQNWYLTNTLTPDPQPSVRPEGGAYLGNAYAANNMFQMSLHDRIGEVRFTEYAQQDDNAWVRYDKRKTEFKESTGQIQVKQDYDVVQFGFDVMKKQARIENGNRLTVLGIMGGYGDAISNAHGSLYSARGNVKGWSAGLYATWYDEYDNQDGRYLDVWALWNDYDAKVYGEGLTSESYGMDGWTASVEGGYDKLLTDPNSGRSENRFLKLQAQVTYQGVSNDSRTESNGTQISSLDRNIQTRIGARYYSKPSATQHHQGQPYVELNWYHNTKPTVIGMDETDIAMKGSRNIEELKLGYELRLQEKWQLWGYTFIAVGENSYRSSGFRFGLKTMF